MGTKLILAIFAPALLVLLFTHITYNRFVAVVLTVALIAASSYKGYTGNWYIIIVDAASLTFGLYLAQRVIDRQRKKLALADQ